MFRAVTGLFKGLVVGVVVSAGLLALAQQGLNLQEGVLPYLVCVGTGALVGMICGRSPWKVETVWVSVLKSMFGVVVCTVGYAVGHAFLPPMSLFSLGSFVPAPLLLNTAVVLIPMVSGLCGLMIEWDDGGVSGNESSKPAAPNNPPAQ